MKKVLFELAILFVWLVGAFCFALCMGVYDSDLYRVGISLLIFFVPVYHLLKL